MLDRRTLVVSGALAGLGLGLMPELSVATADTDRRFVFVILRGAADGLSIVAPTGDPDFAVTRGALARSSQGGARLNSMFTLHPQMPESARLYAAKEALFVHAVASPYRDRSHFDGQNVLETGAAAPYGLNDGWINRMIGLLPRAEGRAVGIATSIPQAMRGKQPVDTYAAGTVYRSAPDFEAQISALYQGDSQLHDVWQRALATQSATAGFKPDGASGPVVLGQLTAALLNAREGARIAMIELGGWDTHAQQHARLFTALGGLDAMIAALKAGLGPGWARTTVLVATEFGRTVAINGTGGTDHGTGTVAMLYGGAVKGGRVIADWPGLKQAALYEGRDLRPTTSLHSVIAGAVAGHFGLEPGKVTAGLFPGSTAKPSEGLTIA